VIGRVGVLKLLGEFAVGRDQVAADVVVLLANVVALTDGALRDPPQLSRPAEGAALTPHPRQLVHHHVGQSLKVERLGQKVDHAQPQRRDRPPQRRLAGDQHHGNRRDASQPADQCQPVVTRKHHVRDNEVGRAVEQLLERLFGVGRPANVAAHAELQVRHQQLGHIVIILDHEDSCGLLRDHAAVKPPESNEWNRKAGGRLRHESEGRKVKSGVNVRPGPDFDRSSFMRSVS
jgi:hypothetical protein